MGPHGLPAKRTVLYKSEENTLVEELHALRYEIRIWSEEYFGGSVKASSKRPYLHRAKELFGNLTDNYHMAEGKRICLGRKAGGQEAT